MGISWSPDDLPGPVGPFIPAHYVPENITKGDFTAATVVWALTVLWAGICSYQSYQQTKQARNAWKSVYIWLVWLEIVASFAMGLQCWIYMFRLIHPSFFFYFTVRMC